MLFGRQELPLVVTLCATCTSWRRGNPLKVSKHARVMTGALVKHSPRKNAEILLCEDSAKEQPARILFCGYRRLDDLRNNIAKWASLLIGDDILPFSKLQQIIKINHPHVWAVFSAQHASFDGWSFTTSQDIVHSWLHSEHTAAHERPEDIQQAFDPAMFSSMLQLSNEGYMAAGDPSPSGNPLPVADSNVHGFAQSPGGHAGLAQFQGIFQAGHEALSGGELASNATLYRSCRYVYSSFCTHHAVRALLMLLG